MTQPACAERGRTQHNTEHGAGAGVRADGTTTTRTRESFVVFVQAHAPANTGCGHIRHICGADDDGGGPCD